MTIQTVAVIGADTTGRRLGALFSAAGYETILEDILPSNLRRAAEDFTQSTYTPTRDATGAKAVRFASSVEDAVRTADLVVDCVPDELESKLEIFSLLDRMAPPRAIFVTPTKHLSIADLASCTYRPDRCIAAEFEASFLVIEERVPITLTVTSLTSPAVVEAVTEFWMRAGFVVGLRNDPVESSVAAGTLF